MNLNVFWGSTSKAKRKISTYSVWLVRFSLVFCNKQQLAVSWKWMVGRLVSLWDGLFLGDISILGGVCIYPYILTCSSRWLSINMVFSDYNLKQQVKKSCANSIHPNDETFPISANSTGKVPGTRPCRTSTSKDAVGSTTRTYRREETTSRSVGLGAWSGAIFGKAFGRISSQ